MENTGALLLIAWESYRPPIHPEYTKPPSNSGVYSHFLVEKLLLKTIFKKPFTRYFTRYCLQHSPGKCDENACGEFFIPCCG
jgi:hypothetical protein